MRYEDENTQIIRRDSLMVSISSKFKTPEQLVDFQISLYCLILVIKNDLEEFKKENSITSFEDMMNETKYANYVHTGHLDTEIGLEVGGATVIHEHICWMYVLCFFWPLYLLCYKCLLVYILLCYYVQMS